MGLELIFVDDDSKDRSFELLIDIKARRPKTKLIKLTKNFGEPAASGTGFAYATGDCITVLAADLQNPPEQIIPMIEAWEHGYKLVLSYRRSRKDPFLTKVMAVIYYALLEALVLKGYPKTGTDTIFFDKSLLPYVQQLGRGVNYSLYLFSLGFEAKLLPYERQSRKNGKSRWTFKKKYFYFLDTITGISVAPLRMVSHIGLGVSLISLFYGIFLIYNALAHGIEVPGFITLAVIISFSTSIIVTMLSMIGEYLWRIFEINNHQPKSVIEKIYL
jgi:dolichol-phosphate mannosyltransferase